MYHPMVSPHSWPQTLHLFTTLCFVFIFLTFRFHCWWGTILNILFILKKNKKNILLWQKPSVQISVYLLSSLSHLSLIKERTTKHWLLSRYTPLGRHHCFATLQTAASLSVRSWQTPPCADRSNLFNIFAKDCQWAHGQTDGAERNRM